MEVIIKTIAITIVSVAAISAISGRPVEFEMSDRHGKIKMS